MSLLNRPDERRREEARIARANQVKPLADPEQVQIVQGNSTFSRVSVPNSQLDAFSKNIMEILGPYHNVLGGPSTNGLRASRISELPAKSAGIVVVVEDKSSTNGSASELGSIPGSRLQQQSSSMQQSQPNSRPMSSSSLSTKAVGGGPPSVVSKRPSSLGISHSSSSRSSLSPVLPSKLAKPAAPTPAESNAPSASSSQQQMVVVSSSSSSSPPLSHSPAKHKDASTTSKDPDGRRDMKHSLPSQMPSPPAVKQKPPPTSHKPPKTETPQQHKPVTPHSHSISKSKPPSSSSSLLPSSGATKMNPRDPSPTSSQSSGPATAIKDYISSYTDPISNKPSSPAALSLSNVSNNSKISPSADKPSSSLQASSSIPNKVDSGSLPRPHSSYSARAHLTPEPRPRSTTPTDILKSHQPNGLTTRHPKLTVPVSVSLTLNNSERATSTSSAQGSSTANTSTEKRSLKVKIPDEIKIPASKSDLIDIIKEMAELQDPLTAIETPHKLDKQFPFYSQASASQSCFSLFSSNINKSKGAPRTSEVKLEAEEAAVSKKERTSPKKETTPVPSETPTSRTQSSHVVKNSDRDIKPDVKPKKEQVELSDNHPLVSQDEIVSIKHGSSKHKHLDKPSDDNSILIRDLDLSEDSDVEPAVEDNTSECQSKKGKVMVASSAGAPVKKAVSPMSSSSSNSSSSESSSESGGDDDDDDEKDNEDKNAKTNDVEAKKSPERRLSSSSSSSSSSSESGSDEEDNGQDAEKQAGAKKAVVMTELKAVVERGEKTPSPPHRQGGPVPPASVGTPTSIVQEQNSETSVSWGLTNFMQPKKNSSSPASLSPFKSGSPPLSHSAPSSVQQKDDAFTKNPDQGRPATLREVGHSGTLSFDTQPDKALDGDNDDNIRHSSERGDVDSFIKKTKTSDVVVSKQSWNSTLPKQSEHRKRAADVATDNSRKTHSRESLHKSNSASLAQKAAISSDNVQNKVHSSSIPGPIKDKNVSITSSSNSDHKKSKTPALLSRTRSIRPRSSSSSNDEVDVESYTPDEKIQKRLLPSPSKLANAESLQKLSKKLFNGDVSDSSQEEWKSLVSGGSQAERRKVGAVEPQPSTNSTPPGASGDMPASNSANKTSKKALGHLEAISKPPNLLSPLQSTYSSPSVPSTKPLPSFVTSFSPLHSCASAMPPYVTLSRNMDGSSQPKIVVQIRRHLLNKTLLSWIKDKRKRRRKSQREEKSSEPSKCDNTSSSSMPSSSSELATSTLPSSRNSLHSDSPAAGTAQNTPVRSSLSSSSQAKSDKLTSLSISSSVNKSGGSSASNNSTSDRGPSTDNSKSDKTNTSKRKLDIAEESSPKKNKQDLSVEKGSSTAIPVAGSKRRDSTTSTSSRESHQSTSSKKPRRASLNNAGKGSSGNNSSLDETSARLTNGPDNGSLPFDHYVNGIDRSSDGSVNSRTQQSLLPANLPQPSPVETQLHTTKHYLARATEHKHHADNLKDKLAKYEPYLRSGLSFFLAGYSMELSKRELSTSYSMYNDTSNLLQYVIRMRANSSSNPECSDRERKLVVLIIRLQAYLNHRLYRLRRTEVSKLKKVIESEQNKYHSSSATAGTASSSTNASSSNNTSAASKPHAPSPHQNSWNKNSIGTPSPMSPTPSPAGSVSSQGSCEIVTGKIPNGNTSSSSTPLTSPSPSMVSIHHRVHAVTQKYFTLTSHMVKALELWDLADAESRGFEDFFSVLDNACGPLSFHSDPPVVVRYMKYALRLLNL